jgi:hypothetical protein
MALILTLVAFAALPAKAEEYKALEWTDLLPEEDLKKMEQLPEISHEGGESAPSSPLGQAMANQDPAAAAWNDVLMSANVKGELNNQKVKVPGFIVPVEYDADQNVTAFFLVPYFGACIHVPPPPPNQIIFVTNKQKIKADQIYSPFWISGTLTTESMSHDLAKSAYSMKADKIEEYVYE